MLRKPIEVWTAISAISVLLFTLSVTRVHAQSAAFSSTLPLQLREPNKPRPDRKSRGLRIGGAVVLLASYATTAGVGLGFLLGGGLGALAAGDDTPDGKVHCKTCAESGLMLIPIAGPWIALANGEPIGAVPAVLLGLGQLVGLSLLVASWAPWADRGHHLGQRVQLYAAPLHDGAALSLHVTF